MHTLRIACAAALLLAAGVSTAVVTGGRSAVGAPAKTKTFACSASSACVTAANTGAGLGISSTSTDLDGVFGVSRSAVASGVYGEGDNASSGSGVMGRTLGAPPSYGMVADGGSGGALPLLLYSSDATFTWMLEGATAQSTFAIAAGNTGNLTLAYLLLTGGQCFEGCSGTRRVITYGGTGAQPALQDAGEAALHDGSATVALGDAFQNAIEGGSYVVLLTPESATKGLYVASRHAGAFTVREIHNGHGSATFAYRIIARPYGRHVRRLPVIADPRDAERAAVAGG